MAILMDLKEGSIVYFENMPYKVLATVSLTEVLIHSIKEPELTKMVKVSELMANPTARGSEQDISLISDAEWEKIDKKYAAIEPCLKSKHKNPKDVKDRAKELGVNFNTVYRWIREYNETGTKSSLIPKISQRGGKGKGRVDEKAEAIISDAINNIFLNPQKYPLKTVYREIVDKCKNAKLTIPHINTVRSRINSINPKDIARQRENKTVRETRGMPNKFPFGNFPLDVVEIDHTKLDVVLVDETHRKEIGRPYITVAVDVYSRMVAGFYVSLEAPSFFNTGQCILNAILPKDRFLSKLDVDGEWPIYGIFRCIHLDNAREFRSADIQRFCSEYGIEINWRPVARPEFGGHIERLLGTAAKEIHTLPGSTFSNVTQRGKYNSEKHAALTISELEKWLAEYFVNVYHKTVHSSLGMTPEEKYIEGVFGIGDAPGTGLPAIPADTLKLRVSLLPSVMRSVQHNGITIDHISYFSDVLRAWIKPRGAKKNKKDPQFFICKRDTRDTSKIYFYDPKIEEYFEVPYRNTSNPKMDMGELRQSIAKTREENGSLPIEEHDIFDAYRKLKDIENRAVEAKKSIRRKVSSKAFLADKKKQEPKVKVATSTHAKEISNITTNEAIEAFGNITYFDVEIIDGNVGDIS